ncbi:MAG: hypothetical protein R3Y11_02320 [Pseudomonadota bacterium]
MHGLYTLFSLVLTLTIVGPSTAAYAHNVGFLTMGVRLYQNHMNGPESIEIQGQKNNTAIQESSKEVEGNTASKPEAYMPNAGIAEVEHTAMESHGTLDVAIWYPTNKMPQNITIGRWQLQAARNANPVEGRFPLVIISHDAGEMRLHHHSLANFLAQNGFVVACVNHPYDCNTDMSAMFTLQQLVHRPQHIQHLVDALMQSPKTKAMIDAQHIAFIGFGVGATTGLSLAGGVPSPDAWPNYCMEAEPTDMYCSTWAKKRLDSMSLALADALHIPENMEQKAKPQSKQNGKQDAQQASPIYPKMPELRDERIKSFTLITPAYGMFFPAHALRSITAPILLIQAEYDSINQKPFHADALRVNLPTTPEFFHLKEAGHFSLRDTPNLAPRHENLFGIGDEENTASLEPTLSAEQKKATQEYVQERILQFIRSSLSL